MARKDSCILVAALLIACTAPAMAQFEPQGPAPLNEGGVDGMEPQDSPVAGAIEAVATHPELAGTLLIGAVNGGIWRTENATDPAPSWTLVSDAGSISDIKYDLADDDAARMLAGIGRTSSFGREGSDRNGLLHSTDGGRTWQAITTLPNGPNVRAVEVRGANLVVGVDTADNKNCDSTGLFQSPNTGATFQQRLAGVTFDVSANPRTTDEDRSEIFASLHGGGCGPVSGIYRSADSGGSWTKVSNTAIDNQVTDATNIAISVGHHGGDGNNANVYVAICGASGQLSSLWRSPDSGTTWTAMSLPASTAFRPQGIHPGRQCGLHLSLQADPDNHKVVYIGGDRQPDNNEETGIGFPDAPQFPNSYGSFSYSGQLHRRDSDGTLNGSLTHCSSAALPSCSAQSTSGSAPHADSRDMAIAADGSLIQSDDGGVYRRSNPLGVGDWTAVVGDLQITEQHDAAYDTISNSILAGNQDNSNGFRDGTVLQGPASWTTTDGGDGGDVAVAINDPGANRSTRYSSAQNLLGFSRRVFDSTNTQVVATARPALDSIPDPAMSGQFVHPIAVNRVDPSRIAFGGGNGVYESRDRGDTIRRTTTDRIFQGQNFVYGTTGNADFLAYSRSSPRDGRVCIRIAAPPALPTCTFPPGMRFFPVDIVVDPGDANRLVVVNAEQVFQTTNGGTNWTEITGDLLNANNAGQLHSAEFIRNQAGTMIALVIGTRNGVFFDLVASQGAGAQAFGTYAPLATGLGRAPAFDLEYDPIDDRLLVGTLGRGAFTLDGIEAMMTP